MTLDKTDYFDIILLVYFVEGMVVYMYDDYKERCKRKRKATIQAIKEHYESLYEALEVESIPQIAAQLEMEPETLRLYLKKLYTEKNNDGKYSRISLLILLCTKLTANSPYYEEQQELRDKIKRREIVKIIRKCKQTHK